jgi:hypothetical protein
MNSFCTLVCECVTSSSQRIKHKSHYNTCLEKLFLAYVMYYFAKTHLRIDANAIKTKKHGKTIISIQQENYPERINRKLRTENQEHDTQTGRNA